MRAVLTRSPLFLRDKKRDETPFYKLHKDAFLLCSLAIKTKKTKQNSKIKRKLAALVKRPLSCKAASPSQSAPFADHEREKGSSSYFCLPRRSLAVECRLIEGVPRLSPGAPSDVSCQPGAHKGPRALFLCFFWNLLELEERSESVPHSVRVYHPPPLPLSIPRLSPPFFFYPLALITRLLYCDVFFFPKKPSPISKLDGTSPRLSHNTPNLLECFLLRTEIPLNCSPPSA